LAVAATAAPAGAQHAEGDGSPAAQPSPSPGQLAEARRHFDQAEAYLKAGAFADAAKEYIAAYVLVPTPVLLFNAGLAWEQHGDVEAAADHYDRYLAAEPEGVKAVEARARRAALAPEVAARRQQAEAAAKVTALREQAAAHTAAGRHTEAVDALLEVQRLAPDPELDFAIGEAYLTAGDRARAESAYRRYHAGEGTAHRDDAEARLRELAALPPTAQQPSKLPELVAYSAAGTALIVGVALGISARSQASDLEAAIDRGSPPIDTGDERFDDGRHTALIANVAFGATAVAAGIGAFFTIRRLRARNAASSKAVTVSPIGRGAALAYEVRW
jgi:tetratricopeptide (TPR) repeat protein